MQYQKLACGVKNRLFDEGEVEVNFNVIGPRDKARRIVE